MRPKTKIEEEIAGLKMQNRYEVLRLKNLQDSLDDFMAWYFEQMGDLCMALDDINKKIASYKNKILGRSEVLEEEAEQPLAPTITPRESELEREVKALYRKLIRILHPEISEEKLRAAEYTKMVNDAYNQRNFRALIEIDAFMASSSPREEDYNKQRAMLLDSVYELKQQAESVMRNPVYEIKLRFEKTTDGGKNIITNLRRSLERQIEARKHDLMETKLEYLEKISKLITA